MTIQIVELPPTVKIINNYTFERCSTLTSVTLHEGLKLIDTWAFASTGLESVEVPAGVECINDSAFS